MPITFRSIRFRFLMVGIGVIIIISLAYVTAYSSISSRIVTDLIYEDTALHIEAHKQSIENWLGERVNEIEIMAHHLSFHSMGRENIFLFLKDGIVKHSDKYLSLLYAEKNGDYMTDRYQRAGNILDRPYFPKALGGRTIISNPVISKSTGQEVLVIATPIREKNRSVVGVFAGTIDLKTFYRFVEGFVHTKHFQNTYIITGSGTIIAHTDSSLIMKENITRSSQHIDAQLASKSHEILQSKEGSIVVKNAGERQMIAFQEIPNTQGWKVITEIPLNHLLAPIKNITNGLVLFAVGMVLLGIIAFRKIAQRQAQPIIELKEAFDEAAAGNLMVRADTHYEDELGKAGKSFNVMMDRMNKLTYYDPLTSLPNRHAFMEHLKEEFSQMSVTPYCLGILILSIEGFRNINEMYGYKIGDSILIELAEAYQEYLHREERVSRINGDEFIFIIKEWSKKEVLKKADKIFHSSKRSFIQSKNEIQISVKAGLSFYNEEVRDSYELIKRAEIAKSISKKSGMDEVMVYVSEMKNQLEEQLDRTQLLHKALKNQEFIIHYQPIVSLDRETIVGAEALLRWNSPEKGLVQPASFIPILEETKLILPVGEWLIYEVCRQNKEWQNMGLKPIKISINVSVLQLEEDHFVRTIENALKETGLEAKYLQLEITESIVMNKTREYLEKLQALNHMGVQFSVDDFGTGYSSLRYIKDFPIQNLKIDQSFIQEMLKNKKDRAIVSMIIAIAQALNLTTTAEGVEDKRHLETLKKEGCHFAQGYYLSQPVHSKELEKYLKNDRIFL